MTRLRTPSLLAIAAFLALAWTAPHHLQRARSIPRVVVTRIETLPAGQSARTESSMTPEAEVGQNDGTPATADTQDDKSITVKEGFVIGSKEGVELIVLPVCEDRDFVTLDPAAARVFDGIDLGGEELEEYLGDVAPVERAPRLWVKARVRIDVWNPEEDICKGTLLALLSVDPISKQWMQAYKVCNQQANSLGSIANELPSPSKASRLIAQRDLAVKAFQDLRSARDRPPLPGPLASLVGEREWTHGEEVVLRHQILDATERIGLAPEGDCWVRGAPGWSDPMPLPAQPVGVLTEEERARQELGRFGMEVEELDAEARKVLVLAQGVRVLRVDPFSPAARAGVLPGDVLRCIECTDYRPSSSDHPLYELLAGTGTFSYLDPDGDHPFFLTFLRGGELMRVKIERP